MKHGFDIDRLEEFAFMEFHCHKSGKCDEENGDYYATDNSVACAGQLIFNQKRNQTTRFALIAEDEGIFDRTKLNMEADVR